MRVFLRDLTRDDGDGASGHGGEEKRQSGEKLIGSHFDSEVVVSFKRVKKK